MDPTAQHSCSCKLLPAVLSARFTGAPTQAAHTMLDHGLRHLPLHTLFATPVWRYDLRQDRGVSWEAACAVRDEAVQRMEEEAAEGEEHVHHSGFYTCASLACTYWLQQEPAL